MEKSLFAQNEEEVLKMWEDKNIFNKTLEKDAPKGNFVFYEGPPTANGKPGIHHVLARSFKDLIPRFKTMQGFRVQRKAGWDTHGLPVELQVEKQLGISGKPDIEKYGIEKFNKKCKESVWKYKDEWEKLTNRIGYWLDLENPYVTYENEYMESVWAIVKKAEERNLLYKGYKVVPNCPSCGTALSSHEVAQGYKNVEDASVYIKFKVKDQDNTYILSWTTTPWTLPGNIALAVGANLDYVKVKHNEETYILAADLVEEVLGEDVDVQEKLKGSDIVGWEYEPLFPGSLDAGDKKAWYVGAADFVTTTDGTGIVHTAAMYGEDDFNFGLENDLPLVHTVNEDGTFKESVAKWAGKFVKDKEVERGIITDLQSRNLLLRERPYEHDYPFCWRCSSPLLYYAKDSWFIAMSKLREELIKNNEEINWVPKHIKAGRFGEWIGNVKDWAISRQRYWGTPSPIWECADCKKYDVIGSMADLESKAGELPKDSKGKTDLHRPFVDQLAYECECGGEKKRVEDVLDVWLDSGTMPFSQHHYPFENKELVDSGEQYPAEFISEAIDQTRGWFYTMLAVSTLLGKGPSFKNVICLGHIMDSKGKKMSKSKGNVVDPWKIMDQYGVDALRMLLFSMNQPGDTKNFDEKSLKEALQKNIMLLGNVVNFYFMYAGEKLSDEQPTLENKLDQWIMAKLHSLVSDVTDDLENYHVFEASRKVTAFIDELSTWYVRRSRDRFKTDGPDKEQAILTLGNVLITLVKVMAPFTPFTSERLYQKLSGEKESVHLEEWPTANQDLIDEDIVVNMSRARQVVELSLAARDEAKIKVRQPLAEVTYQAVKLDSALEVIVAEEINVKKVTHSTEVGLEAGHVVKESNDIKISLDTELSDELKQEGLLRELVRQVNNMRKNAKLTIHDGVTLYWMSESAEMQGLLSNSDLVEDLKRSTMTSDIGNDKPSLEFVADKELNLNGQDVWIGLEFKK